jgi:hypothetical protein
MLTAEQISAKLRGRILGGGRYQANCPLHDGGNQALSLHDAGDGVILKCNRGCDPQKIAGWMKEKGWPIKLGGRGKSGNGATHHSPAPQSDAPHQDTDRRLMEALRGVALAKPGVAKLQTLRDGARSLAIPVRHGLLERADVVDRLMEQAGNVGLVADVGEAVIADTIARGLADFGGAEQRQVPPDEKGPLGPDPPPQDRSQEQSTRADGPPRVPVIKSSTEFIAGFIPPDYVLDGVLQQGFLYSLTGQTGAGKTAIMLSLTASVAEGALFAGRETKRLRVLYLAAENPEDVRMRWIALAQCAGFDKDTIEVYFIEGCFKISQMIAALTAKAQMRGGDFGLVVVDTSPAFFEGDDENSRSQMGKHARMMRSLINVIPGKPCVVANCHPVKNPTVENLVPAGGGSFLNEVDGNLTAAKTDSTVELHWGGKFRGPDFAAMHFLIRTVTHQDLKDSWGRLIPTVIAEHISDQAKEDIAAAAELDQNKVLAFIKLNPTASQSSIANAMGWRYHTGEPNKSRAARCLKALVEDKLLKATRRGRYLLTKEGEAVLVGQR